MNGVVEKLASTLGLRQIQRDKDDPSKNLTKFGMNVVLVRGIERKEGDLVILG